MEDSKLEMKLDRRAFCRILGLGTAGLFLKSSAAFPSPFRPAPRCQGLTDNPCKIDVIGLGTVGAKSVDLLIQAGLADVDFTVMSAEESSLARSPCLSKVLLGEGLTKGLGCGANPEVGQACVRQKQEAIARILQGSDVVFIVAGLGGGTGTGGAPVVAAMAKDLGALSVGVVTLPFRFEGQWRSKNAQEGLKRLEGACDLIVTIPLESAIEALSLPALLLSVFEASLDLMSSAVMGLVGFFSDPRSDCLDFQDKKSLFSRLGLAHMGIGRDAGGDILKAAQAAVRHPLLKHVPIDKARRALCALRVADRQGITDIRSALKLMEKRLPGDMELMANVTMGRGEGAEVALFIAGFSPDQAFPQGLTA